MKLHALLKTEDRRPNGALSPTAEAPVLIGFDGAAGGRDALELGRILGTVRGSGCIVAIPHEDAAAEAHEVLPNAELREIGILSPALQLIQCAKREHAGTLVVGSTRRGAISRAMLGSTAKQVLHKAPCEVVVAPRGYAAGQHEGFAKIAVAVDGTPESKLALKRAEDLARQAGATIEVLAASDPVGAGALAKACEPDVDLIVAGSRRSIDRLLLGSMTDHLITEAPCPVLVVPHTR